MRIAVGLLLALAASPLYATDWPAVKFTEVRAYYYNAASAHDCRILDPKGRLDESVVDKHGVLLNAGQVQQLLAAINGRQRVHPITACYVPHHAFIFYNGFGRRVAVFEFCLECLKASPDPNSTGPYYNYPALADLIAELHLPLGPKFKDPAAYRRRYDRMLRTPS